MHAWTHILVHKISGPNNLSLSSGVEDSLVSSKWTIVADVTDDMIFTFASAQAQRISRPEPALPEGWSLSDHSALDAAVPPKDLDFSLSHSAVPFGEDKTPENAQTLKDFARSFGKTHTGPVAMLNLPAYLPGRRASYFEYIAKFGDAVGVRYGGQAMLLGTGVAEWSSRVDEGAEIAGPENGGTEVWEDVGLVWYPSMWHFAKMLDDEEHARLDREHKRGVLRDNPILCCTEVRLNDPVSGI